MSVLALTSLWILMQVHGLEYAGFYESLYRVVRRATFHARHRARVLRLLMGCLGSPYVPAAGAKPGNAATAATPPAKHAPVQDG